MEVRIDPLNDAPRYDHPPHIEMVEDTLTYFDLKSLLPYDPEGEDIFYILEEASPIIKSVTFLENGSMRIVPGLDDVGNGSFKVQMKDASGGSTSIPFNFSIESVNDPPIFRASQNWTIYMNRGESIWLDLTLDPYVFEDVDDPTYSLVLYASSDWCEIDHSDLVISIPQNTTSSGVLITFQLQDPAGLRSDEQVLNLIVNDPLVEELYDIFVSNISVSVNNGEIIIDVTGKENQVIWAVISTETGGRFSTFLAEDPNLLGKYHSKVRDLDLEDGEECSIYLSSTENGENGSQFSPINVRFEGEDEGGSSSDENDIDYILMTMVASVVMVLIFVVLLARRKKVDPVIEE
jgi:hypothetical protein